MVTFIRYVSLIFLALSNCQIVFGLQPAARRGAIAAGTLGKRCMATMTPQQAQQILGVNQGGASRDIQRAYLEKLKQVHPAANPTPHAYKQMSTVHQAYSTLSPASAQADVEENGNGSFKGKSLGKQSWQEALRREKWQEEWQQLPAEMRKKIREQQYTYTHDLQFWDTVARQAPEKMEAAAVHKLAEYVDEYALSHQKTISDMVAAFRIYIARPEFSHLSYADQVQDMKRYTDVRLRNFAKDVQDFMTRKEEKFIDYDVSFSTLKDTQGKLLVTRVEQEAVQARRNAFDAVEAAFSKQAQEQQAGASSGYLASASNLLYKLKFW